MIRRNSLFFLTGGCLLVSSEFFFFPSTAWWWEENINHSVEEGRSDVPQQRWAHVVCMSSKQVRAFGGKKNTTGSEGERILNNCKPPRSSLVATAQVSLDKWKDTWERTSSYSLQQTFWLVETLAAVWPLILRDKPVWPTLSPNYPSG